MYRAASLFATFLVFPALALGAQEADGPTHLYEAYYKVKPADLEEWNRQFFTYAVPVLNELVASGTIEGYNQWQHTTGGEYNIRMAIRASDWNSLGAFWDDYLTKLSAATPDAESQAISRMIQAHRDEIWDMGYVNVPAGLETAYMYAATYQYNFADGAEWYRIWGDVLTPLIEEAMADGVIGGWAALDHNTGGRHNYKVLFMFEDWDHIDDFTSQVLGNMAERNPEDYQKFMSLIQGHDDAIYAPTRQAGN